MPIDEPRSISSEGTPPCDIRIDKDGIWYFRGAEMFRKDIVNHFYRNLTLDDQGRYIIEMEQERCFLEVEDTPFIVKTVHRSSFDGKEKSAIVLVLVDDTIEELNPETLRVGKDHVLYCSIREGRFEARFSRASYYQISDYFEYDEAKDRFYLALNGRQYDINGRQTGTEGDGG